MKYQPVIGLEVHAQLLTEAKIFCGCPTAFGAKPNQHACPVCAGFPGVLPVLNKKVVEFALRAGLATNCRIARFSRLARKNYFYPDLPKGYQISQYEEPLCVDGHVDIATQGGSKRVRLTRIHIEEDAGKNVHDLHEDCSYVDLNRAGVPLLEIVSEPDMRTPEEAACYLKALRAVLQYLRICDGNMEQGSFRCDANVSVRPEGREELGTKIEIKNLNSFRAVEKALDFEIRRQSETLSDGGQLVQETRLWDENREETRAMRTKEYAHDYRYFPDPDLLPLVIAEGWIEEIRRTLPELPQARKHRFITEYSMPEYDADLLTGRRDVADYFETAVRVHRNPKAISNWVVGDLFRVIKERSLDDLLQIDNWPVLPHRLAAMVKLIDQGKISGKIAKTIFDAMVDSNRAPEEIVEERGLQQVSDNASIEADVVRVLAQHPKQVADYRAGNEKILGFLVGQMMKVTKGRANPKLVNEILRRKLKSDAE